MLPAMVMSTPEEIGIKSSYIENFLNRIDELNIRMHSFIVMRNGKVGAEGYWKPFTPEQPHRMYSATKSFVAAAVGVAADEGKISLDDKLVDYFEDLVPENVHPYIKEFTIRNLLMMSTGYSKPTYGINISNWLESYFLGTPDHPAGTLYNYDSCGSYVLGALVKRVTGKKFDEYLKEKVLLKLGFAPDRRCLLGPDGECWAGSGLIITTRELAAFTNLILNGGKFNGEQLISEKFCKEMISPLVINRTDGANHPFDLGYGYQTRVIQGGGFLFNGLGGQQGVGYPESGLVFACTSDTQCRDGDRYLPATIFWEEVISKLEEPMARDTSAAAKLADRCASLDFKPLLGEKHTAIEKEVNGKTFKLNDNVMGISNIKLELAEDNGKIVYDTPRGTKELTFGLGHFEEGLFPEPQYPGEQLGTPMNRMYRCYNTASWADDKTLVINACLIDDYVGNLTIFLAFKGKEIGISMAKEAQFFLEEYQGYAGGVMED